MKICNSDELYRIIEAISPEVIFEEILSSYFDKDYLHKSRSTLETDTINRYSETHVVKHIPIDLYNVPSETFFQNRENMLKRIEGLTDINGFNFRKRITVLALHKEYI